MSTLEKLVENLKEFKSFIVYYIDGDQDMAPYARMTFTANSDKTWDVNIKGTIDNTGIAHNISADYVYNMVADLFYRKGACAEFEEDVILIPPEQLNIADLHLEQFKEDDI